MNSESRRIVFDLTRNLVKSFADLHTEDVSSSRPQYDAQTDKLHWGINSEFKLSITRVPGEDGVFNVLGLGAKDGVNLRGWELNTTTEEIEELISALLTLVGGLESPNAS